MCLGIRIGGGTVIILNMSISHMKEQDKNTGENVLNQKGLYHPVGQDSFFINCPCFHTRNQVVSLKQIIVLVYVRNGSLIALFVTRLIRVNVTGDSLELILLNIVSGKKYSVSMDLHTGETRCHFHMMTWDYFLNKLKSNELIKYCEED
jgi:hypothetical protein